MPKITTFGLLTSRSMATKEHAKQLLVAFESVDKGLTVTRCGTTEPLVACDLSKAVSEWEAFADTGFFWKTRRYGGDGVYIGNSSRQARDTVFLLLQHEGVDTAALLPLLASSAEFFAADFAYLHSTFDEEISERQYYADHVMPLTQGLVAPDLEKGLPGIAWAMYFGNGYTDPASRAKLLKAPAYGVRECDSGVLVQVSERLETYSRDYPIYRVARETLATYLNAEMPELMPRPLSGPA